MWIVRHTKFGNHNYQWLTQWNSVIDEMVRGNKDTDIIESQVFVRDRIAEMVINSAISKQSNTGHTH